MIHRTEIDPSKWIFHGPAELNFGYQEQRQRFSIWHKSNATFNRLYQIVGTGIKTATPVKRLVASCVMPDGFTVIHLVEIET